LGCGVMQNVRYTVAANKETPKPRVPIGYF
jgi:hypothetical protein